MVASSLFTNCRQLAVPPTLQVLNSQRRHFRTQINHFTFPSRAKKKRCEDPTRMFAGSMASSSTRQTAEPLRSLEELQSWTAQNLSLDALENVASIALLQTEKDAASEQLLSARRSGADTAGFKTEAAQNEGVWFWSSWL